MSQRWSSSPVPDRPTMAPLSRRVCPCASDTGLSEKAEGVELAGVHRHTLANPSSERGAIVDEDDHPLVTSLIRASGCSAISTSSGDGGALPSDQGCRKRWSSSPVPDRPTMAPLSRRMVCPCVPRTPASVLRRPKALSWPVSTGTHGQTLRPKEVP